MATGLIRDEPSFADALLELDALIAAEAGFSVCEELARREEITAIERLQPVLFAVQVALARLLAAKGLAPAAVIGHSLGEVAAAVAAGALSLPDAVRVVVLRSSLLATLEGTGGAMALLELSPDELAAMPRAFDDDAVEIAAFNAPGQIAVAGPVARVQELVGAVEATGRLAKPIKSTVAGHCRLVDPIVGRLRDGLAGLAPLAAHSRFYTTALADPRESPSFDADYWVTNIRRPVRFAQALAAAADDGHRTFIEISPHPVLLHALLDNARDAGPPEPLVLSTGRRSEDEALHLHAQLATLALDGAALPRPDRAGEPSGARVIDLPTRPWRHERHWLAPRARRLAGGPAAVAATELELHERPARRPRGDPRPDPDHLAVPTRARRARRARPARSDPEARRRLEPTAAVGLGAWLELIRSAAIDAFGGPLDGSLEIRDLVFEAPLPLGDRRVLSTAVDRESRSAGRLTVHSQATGGPWRAHVSASLDAAPAPEAAPPPRSPMPPRQPPAIRDRRRRSCSPRRRAPGTGAAQASPLEGALDALFESLGRVGRDERWVIASIGVTRWLGPLADATRARASVDSPADAPAGSRERTADLQLADADGRVRLAFERIGLRRVRLPDLPSAVRSKLRTRAWHAVDAPPAEKAGAGRWLIVGETSDPLAGELAAALTSHGGEATFLTSLAGGDFDQALRSAPAPERVVVLAAAPAPGEALDDALIRGERAVLLAARVLAGIDARPTPSAGTRIWLVTSLAAAVDERDRPDPGGGALRGLVRALAVEHPELRPASIDLDPVQRLDCLLRELAIDDEEDEIAWRAGRRHVARLVVPELTPPAADARRTVAPDGAYLVTGGLGRNGLLVARWLAERGAARIVLNDIRAPDRAARDELARLRLLGGEIVLIEGDISRPGVAARAVAACGRPGARLRGIAHAADTAGPADAAAAAADTVEPRARWLDGDRLRAAWSAKALGAAQLIAASRGAQLDWWTCFSSAADLLGGPHAAASAPAGACVEALVDGLRAGGVAAGAISWSVRSAPGAGGAGGGAADPVGAITPLEATDALDYLAGHRAPLAGVLKLVPGELARALPALTRVPLFAGILESSQAPAARTGRRSPGLAELTGADAGRAVTDRVNEQIAGVLGIDASRLTGDPALTAAGLDSLLAVRLRNALQHDFGFALPLPLLLGGASAGDVVDWLCDALRLPETSGAKPTGPPGATPGRVPRVGPRDGTERMVAAVWREVLGREDFGVTHEFAALDGDQASALRASELLALRTGRPLVAGDLFARGATIERQAKLLREPDHAGDGSPLRLLRDGVAPTPLFLFHPAGGDTLVYRQLVDCLDPSLTVWGCDRFDGALSVEQRAARYVDLLTGVQPDGPYLLGGWSFGGVLAYETAQLLRAAGERVELLALIDTILPVADPPDRSPRQIVELRFERFAAFLEASYGKPVSLPYERLAELDDESQADVVIDAVVAAGLIERNGNEAIIHHQRTSYVDVRAVERYSPAPYDGRVVFYTPRDVQADGVRDPRFDRHEPARGWDAFCGDRLELVSVPGHHLALLDSPFVETLAGHIDLLLADYRLTVAQ